MSYNSGCQYYYNKKVLNLESSFGTNSVKWNGSANNFLFNFTRSFLWSVIQPFLPVNRDGQHYKRQHSTWCQNDMIKEVALFIFSSLLHSSWNDVTLWKFLNDKNFVRFVQIWFDIDVYKLFFMKIALTILRKKYKTDYSTNHISVYSRRKHLMYVKMVQDDTLNEMIKCTRVSLYDIFSSSYHLL